MFLAQAEEISKTAQKVFDQASSGEILVAVLLIVVISMLIGLYIWKVAIPNADINKIQAEAMAKALDQTERIRWFESTQSTVMYENSHQTQQCMQEVIAELKAMRAHSEAIKQVVENNTTALRKLLEG